MRNVLEELREVFSEPLSGASTGAILNSPNDLSRERALKAVEKASLDELVKIMAATAAREAASWMQAEGLRPADYASMEIARDVSSRLSKAVQSKEFLEAFVAILRMLG